MAISKDDTVLTYSKFKDFWTSFAVLFNKKLDGEGVKNNDTTTDAGYVLDARVGKVHGDEIDTLKDQMNGCYIAYDSNGKLGIKASKNGAVQSFRQPVGTAATGDVLAGKTFANSSSDSNTGTMPNNGDLSRTLMPSGNNVTTYQIPAGYTSGGTITANGSDAYNNGYSAGASSLYDNDTIYGATFLVVPHDTTGYSYAKAIIQIPNGYTKLTIDKSDSNLAYKLSTELSALTSDTSVDGSLSDNQTVDISGYKYVALQMAQGAWAASHDQITVSKWHLSK